LHFGENLQQGAKVTFDVKLPYGVRAGDVVEGRIFSNSTRSVSDHVRGQVVSVNGQLHFQGDESIVVKDKKSGISYPADNRHVGPYDKGGQLDIPLTLQN
jgi:hypothetical protein